MDTAIFERLGLHEKLRNDIVVNGKSAMDILQQLSHPGDAAYKPCPESYPAAHVPRGQLERIAQWSGSELFAGTERDITVYLPAQLDRARDTPNVLVFNDGHYYLDPEGSVRAPLVLDSLIHDGTIPRVVGIFVQPGSVV